MTSQVRKRSQRRKRVVFRFEDTQTKEVALAGSFNEWDATQNPLTNDGAGNFSTSVLLNRSQHEYKFLVDGVWKIDQHSEEWTPNKFGTLNSVITVK